MLDTYASNSAYLSINCSTEQPIRMYHTASPEQIAVWLYRSSESEETEREEESSSAIFTVCQRIDLSVRFILFSLSLHRFRCVQLFQYFVSYTPHMYKSRQSHIPEGGSLFLWERERERSRKKRWKNVWKRPGREKRIYRGLPVEAAAWRESRGKRGGERRSGRTVWGLNESRGWHEVAASPGFYIPRRDPICKWSEPRSLYRLLWAKSAAWICEVVNPSWTEKKINSLSGRPRSLQLTASSRKV